MAITVTLDIGDPSSIVWGQQTHTRSSLNKTATLDSTLTDSTTIGHILIYFVQKINVPHMTQISSAIGSNNTPTSTDYNYSYLEYTITNNGTTTHVPVANYSTASGLKWDSNASISIKFIWTKKSGGSNTGTSNDNYYTLTLCGNGGTKDGNETYPLSITKGYGTNINIDYGFTRSGYTWIGWSSSRSSTTLLSSPLQVNSNMSIYAVWKANGGGGGTTTPTQPSGTKPTTPTNITISPNPQTVDSFVTISCLPVSGATSYCLYDGSGNLIDTLTNPSFRFKGTEATIYYFYISAKNSYGESSKSSKASVTFKNPEPQTYPYTHSVSFDANAGSDTVLYMPSSAQGQVTTTSPIKPSTIRILIPSNVPQRTSYTFQGWGTRSDGIATVNPGDPYECPTTVSKLYAIWGNTTTKITFDYNYTGGPSTTRSYRNGIPCNESPNLGFPTPTRTGYTFNNWWTAKTGGTEIPPSYVYTKEGSVTLYAHWTRVAPNIPVWSTQNPEVMRNKTITLTWRTVSDLTLLNDIQYDIQKNGSQIIQLPLGQVSYDFTAPANYTDNAAWFQVRARNSDGQVSGWSQPLYIGLDRGTPPTETSEVWINKEKVPPTIYLNDKSEPTYDITWTRSIDIDEDMEGYKIYVAYDQENVEPEKKAWQLLAILTKDKTNYQPRTSNLIGYNAIQVYVIAFDNVQNESERVYSNTVTISTWNPPSVPSTIIVPYEGDKLEVERTGKIEATVPFKIAWTLSTDKDGDLAGYTLQERRLLKGADEWEDWGNRVAIPAKNNDGTYMYWEATVPNGVAKVQYRVQAYDTKGLTSADNFTQAEQEAGKGYAYSEEKVVINNVAPTAPSNIVVPEPVKGGTNFLVSWDPSYDEDYNLVGYKVERRLDGGAWQVLDTVSSPGYIDNIPRTRTERHDTVAYRITAIDAEGLTSSPSACVSKTYNIDNNAAPVVTSDWETGTYLGSFEETFGFPIMVTDEEGDPVDITVTAWPVGGSFDGAKTLYEIKNCKTAPSGYSTTVTIPEEIFATLPMTECYLQITAKDKNGEGFVLYQFRRKGSRAFVTMKEAMTYPEPILEVAFTHIDGLFPPDCIRKIEVTNNANDSASKVRWEDCTVEALEGQVYGFKNQLGYTPAFNFRMSVQRGASGASGYISRIAGYFTTTSDYQVDWGD